MSEEIKELQTKFETSLETLREEVDKKTVDTEKVKKINETLDGLDDKFAEIQKVNDAKRLKEEEMEKKLNLLESKLVSANTSQFKSEELVESRKAFNKFLREGKETLNDVDKKYLRTDQNVQGGYLCTTDFTGELVKDLTEVSPIRQISRVMQTSKRSVTLNNRAGLVTAAWTGEGESTTESNSTYGLLEIPVNKLTAETHITNEMLTDSEFDIRSEINNDMVERFAQAEGVAFVSGNAIKKPEGLLTNTDVERYNTGHATLITADSLFGIQGEFKSGYLSSNRLRWIVNQKTLFQSIRILKDGSGNYLMNVGIRDGLTPTIAGLPYTVVPDMPDEGAGLIPMMVGDFFTGYRIVDHTEMSLVVDIYHLASTGKVRYIMHRRVGGQVVKPETLKALRCAV